MTWSLRQPILTLLALLAIAIHVLVIQPHFDRLDGSSAGTGAAVVALADGNASGTTPLPGHEPKPGCFICSAHAVAGMATLALPPVFIALLPTADETPATGNPDLPRLCATHSWQSRAPPVAV